MANAYSMEEPSRKPQGSIPIPKSKRGAKGFFAEVGREIKKIAWPTRQETFRLTGVVLGVCVLIGGIMITMSWAFGVIVDVLTKGKV